LNGIFDLVQYFYEHLSGVLNIFHLNETAIKEKILQNSYERDCNVVNAPQSTDV